MWEAVVVVGVAMVLFGVGGKAWTLWIRRRAVAAIPPERIVRIARDVSIKAMIHGAPTWRGLDPRRNNRTRGDLVLTDDRFVLATGRGVLADLGPDRGRPFTSVRCTGPGRLVLEGDIPRPGGRSGVYRFELVVDDAEGWATALAPFAREGPPRLRRRAPDQGPGAPS